MTIDIIKFDDTKILIEADDKLPDGVALKIALILIICVIKDDDTSSANAFRRSVSSIKDQQN